MSDEYEYGPWIDVPEGGLVQLDGLYRGEAYKGHVTSRYRIATPKPKREFVVGKWYRPLVSGRWQRCIAIEGEMAWLVQPSNHPFAHPWEEGEINWAVSPRDEAPE